MSSVTIVTVFTIVATPGVRVENKMVPALVATLRSLSFILCVTSTTVSFFKYSQFIE
jgi:hypothetical protein